MKGKITYSKEETALFEALGRFIAEASEVDPDEFVKEFRKGNTVEMKYATMSSKVVDGEHVTEIEIDPALAVQVGEVVKDNADNFDAFFVSATAFFMSLKCLCPGLKKIDALLRDAFTAK